MCKRQEKVDIRRMIIDLHDMMSKKVGDIERHLKQLDDLVKDKPNGKGE